MEGVYLLNNIQKGYFDTFYHEHVSTFSFLSLNKLLGKHNLKIVKAKLLNTQGGSFRAYITHKNNNYNISNKTKILLNKENKIGLNKSSYYKKLSKVLKEKIKNLKNVILKNYQKLDRMEKKLLHLVLLLEEW